MGVVLVLYRELVYLVRTRLILGCVTISGAGRAAWKTFSHKELNPVCMETFLRKELNPVCMENFSRMERNPVCVETSRVWDGIPFAWKPSRVWDGIPFASAVRSFFGV